MPQPKPKKRILRNKPKLPESPIYSFDKVRINYMLPLDMLKEKLPMELLKKESHAFNKGKAEYPAVREGFKSWIQFSAPTEEFLQALNEVNLSRAYYAFSSIEFAKDTCFRTRQEPNEVHLKRCGTVYKRYTPDKHLLFKGDKPEENDQYISDRMHYSGNRKTLQYAVYARISKVKVNGKYWPCLHEEFKISEAWRIRKLTGIDEVADLIDYDIQERFEKLSDQYIRHAGIDKMRLGKSLKGCGHQKKFSRRERKMTLFAANKFLSRGGADTFADLRKHVAKQKRLIRKQRGQRSAYQRRILKMDCNRFRMKP